MQANYALLVAPTGGHLVELPQLPSNLTTTEGFAKLTLDNKGTLSGNIREVRHGDPAERERYVMRVATQQSDQIKTIERALSHSLGTFQITKATMGNLTQNKLVFRL